MGCHAGLSVFDAFVPLNNLDWAQLFAQKGAAAYVANTGFGYGDSNTIAYSEDLNRRFAQGAVAGLTNPTGADLTVGEALTVAKQAYKGDLGIVGAYDEKAMAELTLYGLPMYRIGGSGIAPPPAQNQAQAQTQQTQPFALQAQAAAPLAAPAASFPTDPSTGLHVESFNADRTFGPAVVTTQPARGSYYTGTDGLLVEHFRPIEPKAIRPITIEQAHGALLTAAQLPGCRTVEHLRPGLRAADDRFVRRRARGRVRRPGVPEQAPVGDDLQAAARHEAAGRTGAGPVLLGQPDRRARRRDPAPVHARERCRLQLGQHRLRAARVLDARGAGADERRAGRVQRRRHRPRRRLRPAR